MHTRKVSLLAFATAVPFASASFARADIGVPYALVDSFTLPVGSYSLLPDGRLFSIDGTGAVSIQSVPNSSTYSQVGSIGAVNSGNFWPSFVSLSPDGSTLAVGNNEFSAGNAVLFFDANDAFTGSAAPTASILTPNFVGDWADNTTFYVSGGDANTFATVVNRLDLNSGTSTTVINPAGGFSGAVAVANGTLYAGEGDTGNVYAFDLATLASASNPAPINAGAFTASGASAGSIDFDPFGNIIIAGGVFDFGSGLFAGSADVINPVTQERLSLTPAGANSFYGSYFNTATNQLVVTADGTAYVYAIPAPASAVVLGLLALPRRRRQTGAAS